jgi:hypothetical protein
MESRACGELPADVDYIGGAEQRRTKMGRKGSQGEDGRCAGPWRRRRIRITRVVPGLVKVAGTGWGEYLFVEVRTDEGVTGWGEITTTTKVANRAVADVVWRLNDLIGGDDPSRIELIWH